MITRIEVDGFKSLRGFAVDLEPFTVLIGPNSAGKSNVLEALVLLSRLASMPIAEAFKLGRGKSIDQFSRHGAEVGGAIRFAVELLEYGDYPAPERANGKDAFQSRFRYELTIERRAMGSGAERLIAGEERLHAMRREDDTWIPAHPELSAYAGYVGSDQDYLQDKHTAQHKQGTHTALAMFFFEPMVGAVVATLTQCRMLDPGAAHLGEPSERIDAGELALDASNLPTMLADLPPNVLGGIRADLVSLVPGIASFDVIPAGDEIRLEFELSGGARMPARLVSAGTLRILALLTALRTGPSMLCIEEPENGIYPARLRALLELLRDATTQTHEEEAREAFEMHFDEERRNLGAVGITKNQLPTQVLLTTHSPVALATLRSRPQHLRFVDMVRRNGERVTRVRTVGQPGAGEPGRFTISPREIGALLQAVESSEDPG
jgi:predicted ATPase